MKKLHAELGDRVRFLTIFIREAHPGSVYGAHRTFEQKMAYARAFKEQERIPWPVLVDDLEGTVHRAYGELAANVVLIDAAGRIAFEEKWPHVPTLHRALDELLARESATGPVQGGVERTPHLLAAMVGGWHALARGGSPAVRDLALFAPPVVLGLELGRVAGPLLAPVALRHRPLPAWAKAALGATATFAILKLFVLRRQDT